MKTVAASRRAYLAGAAVLLSVSLTSCGQSAEQSQSATSAAATAAESTAAATSAEPTTDSLTDVWRLQVGDCYLSEDYPDGALEIPLVECTEPHDREVFYAEDLTDEAYPGDEAVTAAAEEICTGDAFTEFVGVTYAASELYVFYLHPTQETWEDLGDREVLCTVSSNAEESASLAGSQR